MRNLWSNSAIKQNIFGIQVIKESDPSIGDEDGKWTSGRHDNRVIRRSLATAPFIQHVWWEMTVPTIKVGAANTISPLSYVVLDVGTTLIVFSKADSHSIYSALPGGQLNSSYGVYILWCNVACTYRRNIYFNIGGYDFGVPAKNLIWEQLDSVVLWINSILGVWKWGLVSLEPCF